MLPKVLTREELRNFIGRLTSDYRVTGPVEKEPGRYVFDDIVDTDDLQLVHPITIMPPKKCVTPHWEPLLRFKRGTVEGTAVMDTQPTVLVGIHPCDLYGIYLLDKVFSDKIEDPHYLERRKNTLIIAVDCLAPCDQHQLCLDMGTINSKEGYDLLLVPVGDFFYIEIGTEAGAKLLADFAPEATRPSEDEMEAHRMAMDVKQGNFHHKLPFDAKHLPEILDEAYDSLVWQAVARKCLSCGACNLVCPTCYCFNVVDRVSLNLRDGERLRHWDSCQLDEFATVAGGENFRKDRASRLRHRFFRKGKLIYEAFGRLGCTGCGRCSRHCPAKISLIDTYCQIAGRTTR
jgi:sulfhydrogenase subunit beta (sulfur reductase)